MRYMDTIASANASIISISSVMTKKIQSAANKVNLAITIDPETKSLYGYAVPMLDETATLRRIALFVYGSGKRELTPDEKYIAMEILDHRFDCYKAKVS